MHLEITVDGRPALTARMAVARYRELYGLSERAIGHTVVRSGVQPIDPPPIHGRIPLYDQAAMDEVFARKAKR